MRLALEVCSFARRLSFRGCVSDESMTPTAVLASSGFAAELLLVSLLDAIDGILSRNNQIATGCLMRCFMIADNIRFVAEGEEVAAAKAIVDISDEATFVLEENSGAGIEQEG